MRVIRRVYNTSAFQSYDIEVPAVGTGSTSIIYCHNIQLVVLPGRGPQAIMFINIIIHI